MSNVEPFKVHIRWMIGRDLPEVLDIERESFANPWTEREMRDSVKPNNVIGMVAEHDERVVGFMVYELHKPKLHLINFAVAASDRRKGVGRQMVDKLIGKLSAQRRTQISLEIRETGINSQLFFKRQGFACTLVKKNFYDDSDEDAYYFVYSKPDVSELDELVDALCNGA